MNDYDHFDEFTEQARKALGFAEEEARRFNHTYIGTEHLLLGLVREGEGVAAKVLSNLGVELNKARNSVEFIVGRGDQIILGEIGLTPRSKKVIELAIDEARRLNHDYIGTEHLLLGIGREGEGIAVGVLESLGVNLEKVRTQTILMLSSDVPEPLGDHKEIASERVASPHETETIKALEAVLNKKEAAIQQQAYELAVELRNRKVKIQTRIVRFEADGGKEQKDRNSVNDEPS